jgi:Ulp1 family protease
MRQVPMQKNKVDCAVYVILYVWMFCRLWMLHGDLKHFEESLFGEKQVEQQRRHIGKRIHRLTNREPTVIGPDQGITLHSGGGCYTHNY